MWHLVTQNYIPYDILLILLNLDPHSQVKFDDISPQSIPHVTFSADFRLPLVTFDDAAPHPL